jgi:thiol-disulfide isomerase/thioredoxin
MPRITRVLIVLLLTIFVIAFLSYKFSRSSPPDPAQAFFAASFPDVQGTPQNISQWRGKVIVVNFWASWCPPCREEMPSLDAVQTKYASKGVQFVGISSEDVNKLQQFSKEEKVGYPLLAGDIDAMSMAQNMGDDKSILPYTVVLDKHGNMVRTWFGIVDISELDSTLVPLL